MSYEDVTDLDPDVFDVLVEELTREAKDEPA